MSQNKTASIFSGALISAVVFFFCLVGVEILLRIWPVLLGSSFVNEVRSRYTYYADGIYFYDPVLRINRLKPNYHATLYYNGYEWDHRSNVDGFRIADNRSNADVVLLGDSLVYGHGLNANQTIDYFLENQSGSSVANLGMQGNCAFENLVIFNTFALEYSPKYIFYFFFYNDLSDLRSHIGNSLTIEEMNHFIDTPLDRLSMQKFAPDPYEQYSTATSRPLYIEVAARLFVHRTLALAGSVLKPQPYSNFPDFTNEFFWEYTKKSLLLMKQQSEQRGTKFVIVPASVYYGNINVNDEQFLILSSFARANGIPIIDSRVAGRDPRNFLQQHFDGHYSEDGAKVVADLLLQFIEDHPDGV